MRKLVLQFRRHPLLSAIRLGILFLHFLFLLIILVQPSFMSKKKERKSLIVKTITPKVSKILTAGKKQTAAVQSRTSVAPQKKTAPKPAAQPVIKKQTPATPTLKKEPAIADKTVAKSKQPLEKKPLNQNRAKISDSLLRELEESIAKIENNSDKSTLGKNTISNSPILLQIDSIDEDAKQDYVEILTEYLHNNLNLPEYGEVKVQLSLLASGAVAKVVVLKTQNEKNRAYLEHNLPG